MLNIKKLLLIPIVVIACLFARIDSAYAVDYPFSITTSSIAKNGTFQFTLSAAGTFYVDCGTNGTLSRVSGGSATVSGTTITKTGNVNTTKFKCQYTSSGTKTIRFGGTATNYNTTTYIAAISFYPNDSAANSAALIKSISGNLSTIFPYISGNAADGAQPRFYQTFRNATNITSIPDTLFSGYTVASTYMFYYTFRGCTGLTSIPANLFSNITSGAEHMFDGTFWDCTGLTSIPKNLFFPNATSVSGATYMFNNTFYGCTGLTSIPENLFSKITSGADTMFCYTFYGCTGLTSIPENLFSKITSGADTMFCYTFYGCTGLTSIPENLFSKITSGADGMFASTFSYCTGLTSIPANLFFPNATSVSGAYRMFYYTFRGCTGLTSIPANLFSKITSGEEYMFSYTFYNCTGLTSIPENLFFPNATSVSGAQSMFQYTFMGCTGLTSIPANLFSKITSGAQSMFSSTFKNCSNLTGFIPPTLFSGLINNGSPYAGSGDTGAMYNIFAGTGLSTTCPTGMHKYTTGYESYWNTGNGNAVSCKPGIGLNWYDGNTQLSGNASSCTYGGTFSVPPTPPARTGYIFSGWRVKAVNP